jgi:hypothetical protein
MHLAYKLISLFFATSEQINDISVEGDSLIILGLVVRVESNLSHQVPVGKLIISLELVLEITEGWSSKIFEPEFFFNVNNVERKGGILAICSLQIKVQELERVWNQ